MDGTGVRGILSICDYLDSVVGMVQVSTELTTHRKNNGFMGDFMGMSNPCTERTEAEKVTSNDQNKQTYILPQINTKTLFFCNNCVTIVVF